MKKAISIIGGLWVCMMLMSCGKYNDLFGTHVDNMETEAMMENTMNLEPPDSTEFSDTGFSEDEAMYQSEENRQRITVNGLRFERLSRDELAFCWDIEDDQHVKDYVLKRRKEADSAWEEAASVAKGEVRVIDHLPDIGMQQYEYRIDVVVDDDSAYIGGESETIYASNILICLDPGHYAGVNYVPESDGWSYCEGDFTLKLAYALRDALMQRYGVTAWLTREGGSININGHVDGELDNYYLAQRGEVALGSDMFISLHTNANQEYANGFPTCVQPESINKPIVLLNQIAVNKPYMLAMANAVGSNLAKLESDLGLGCASEFRCVEGVQDLTEWTDAYNDGLDEQGTVCYRLYGDEDYYGVLRGSAAVGVPGMTIEHGFHTVPEFRRLAAEETFDQQLAEQDAIGIAQGLGLRRK